MLVLFSLFKAHLTMLIAAHHIQGQMRCHKLRRLVAVFSLRGPSIAQRAVCVEFLVHKVAVGLGFLREYRSPLPFIILSILHNRSPNIPGMRRGPVSGLNSTDVRSQVAFGIKNYSVEY